MREVTLIIPTLDEEEGISKVLSDIPEEELSGMGYSVEVLVVDGGSSDGTRERAREHGAEVLLSDGRKAEAVKEGFKRGDGDIVFVVDGDSSYPVEVIPEMLEELEACDMVLGSRFSGEIKDGSMSRLNRVGNRGLTWFANVLYGTEVNDLCTGLRGMRRRDLDGLDAHGFEIEAALHARYSDGEIREVPIVYSEREGHSKLRVWDGLNIAKRLILDRLF